MRLDQAAVDSRAVDRGATHVAPCVAALSRRVSTLCAGDA
jgi:hypothetical protein